MKILKIIILLITSNIIFNVNISLSQYGQAITLQGDTVDLFLDVYQPTGDTANMRPLIIVIHGGSFVVGDKTDAEVVGFCNDLAKMGYVTSSINYRLGFSTIPPDSISVTEAVLRATHDARAAVRFFRRDVTENGNTWKIDTNKIFLLGSSAGGITALHLAYLDDVNEVPSYIDTTKPGLGGGIEGNSGNPGYSSKVTAIISLSGAIGDSVWIKPGDTPVLSFHGDQDVTVPFGSDTINVSGVDLLSVDGSQSVHIRADNLGINNCFKPFWGAGHTPNSTDAQYYDTTLTYLKHFLLQFVCNAPSVCDYTTDSLILTNCSSGRYWDQIFATVDSSMDVIPPWVNKAPFANDDTVTTKEGVIVVIDVQNNDIDLDGDSLITAIIGVINNGTASVLNADSIQYTPNAGFIGTDTINYEVCDNGPLCDQARVTITVTPGTEILEPLINQNDVVIYPNPANDHVIVDLRKFNQEQISIEIFNYMGQLVRKYNHHLSGELLIKREELSKGLYFLNIKTGQSGYTGKILFD